MNLSHEGLTLIKENEGLRLHAYADEGGVPTIGYGHTGPDVTLGLEWTEDEATWALMQDTYSAVSTVNRLVTVPLEQHEFDALVDFVYNVGERQFATSTLLRLVNAEDFDGAADQFERWHHIHGKDSAGLLRRRLAEAEIFKGTTNA